MLTKFNVVEGNKSLINEELKGRVRSLGVLSLTFNFVKNLRRDYTDFGRPIITKAMAVPETALKGESKSHQLRYAHCLSLRRIMISSCVETLTYPAQRSLGEPRDAGPVDPNDFVWGYDYVGDAPFATFNFKYRSLGTSHICLAFAS